MEKQVTHLAGFSAYICWLKHQFRVGQNMLSSQRLLEQILSQIRDRFEPARLHNKLDKKLNVAVMYGWNIKRFYNFTLNLF